MTTHTKLEAYRVAFTIWYEQKRKYPDLNFELSKPKPHEYGLNQWEGQAVQEQVKKTLSK